MVTSRTSIKSLLSVAALAALSLLAGCGGGGAVTPSCADNNSCPVVVPPTPPLVINPTALNAYAGTPVVVTISSGVGPFQVFTSDATVLPVTQVVSGASITLVPNAVNADQVVSLTVRDAAGQSAVIAVTVKPSPLLGSLTITPTSNTTCAGVGASVIDKAAICSGESGLAALTISSNATSILPNRQVRFDVVQGGYNFVINQAGTVVAKTITVLTDQNGRANAVIRTDAAVASQVGLLRATDVVSGNRVDASFTIVQAINGTGVLSLVPEKWTVTGNFNDECAAAGVDYLIYGGLAPYTVTNTLPAQITLFANGISSATSVVVPQAGGRFTAFANYSSPCTGYDASFVITDATGRNVTGSYSGKPGAAARAATEISPTAITVTAPLGPITSAPGVTPVTRGPPGPCSGSFIYTAAGGFTPLSWSLSVPPSIAVLAQNSNNGVLVTIVGGFNVPDVITITAIDRSGKLVKATLTCGAPSAT